MAEKACVKQRGEVGTRRLIIWASVGLVVAVAFVIFLLWAILHPQDPRFVLEDLTIYDFNTSQPNLLSINLQVTVSSRNPNNNIGIFYDRLDIYASYHNQEVTYRRAYPSTYQGHEEVTVWSPVLIGSAMPVAPYTSPSLDEDLYGGRVLLNIKIDGSIRWKGSWIFGGNRLHVNCQAYINFPFQSVTAAPGNKYPLDQQRCAVDI